MAGNSEEPKVDHSHDGEFFLTFAAVLGALFVITGLIIVAALMYASDSTAEAMPADQKQRIADRVAPVGKVITDASQIVEVAVAPSGPRSGAEIVTGVCAGCHSTGVPGAPQISDTATWKKELKEEGLDHLIAVAIKGEGGMPARGGDASLSDEEVAAAVKEMLTQSGAM